MSTADTTSLDSHKSAQVSEGDAARKGPAPPKGRPPKTRRPLTYVIILACALALGGGGAWYWWQQRLNALPPGIAQANGRLESEQVEIATTYAGRIAVVLAKEGDMVQAGAVLARMDTVELEAQLRAAEAQVRKAEQEKVMAEAQIVQRDSERTFARQELQRTSALVEKGWSTREQYDQRQSQMKGAQ